LKPQEQTNQRKQPGNKVFPKLSEEIDASFSEHLPLTLATASVISQLQANIQLCPSRNSPD
jgi:hypothetical protein